MKTTRDILRSAEGCVLVIDEAYALCSATGINNGSDSYGTDVINTLVEQIQARPGDDRAVILLGYEKEMTEMMKNVNKGLSRRFQLENAFQFPDFSDEDLVKVLMQKAKGKDLELTIGTAKRAVRKLAKARAKPNFGNAGAVDYLLAQAVEHKQARPGAGASSTLEPADFGVEADGPDNESLDSLFDGLVGLRSIKRKLEEIRDVISFARQKGHNAADRVDYNFLFLGNPGTGKTTVARLMGRMYYSAGLLPCDDVYQKSPKDFNTGYLGQAGLKTRDILTSARGGVLFIDEAYQLNPDNGNTYNQEVIDELCAALTEDEFRRKIVVVLAGYTADMQQMLDKNVGLQSRFTCSLDFEDMDIASICEHIRICHSNRKCDNLPLADSVTDSDLHNIAEKLQGIGQFSNYRDVEDLCDKAYRRVAMRHQLNAPASVTTDDLDSALKELSESRMREAQKVSPKLRASASAQPAAQQAQSSSVPPPPRTTTHSATMAAPETIEKYTESMTENDDAGHADVQKNPFVEFNKEKLNNLQDVLDELGLNNADGVRQLGADLQESIAQALEKKLGCSRDEAIVFLHDWQRVRNQVEEQMKEQKRAAKTSTVEAIWHCAACGRGGCPTPVCYVAPYISEYRKKT